MEQDFIMLKPEHLNRAIAVFEQWRLTKNKHQTNRQ